MKLPENIPRATYRLQLHADFTFAQLAQIIPYLQELGISDVYCSPFFCASPGSTHGYDVCDHNQINAELGGLEGLMKVSQFLRERNMGLLIDFVPNHMGIEGSLNWRWLDVLENGHLSRFASFFDIQWNPRQTSLQDRIMLPLLHDFYGRVLESGDFRIHYADDAFWVGYRSLRFPLRPESYGNILQRLAWFKNPGNAVSQQLEKLADRFRDLTKSPATDAIEDAEQRHRQRDVLRRELASIIHLENLGNDLNQVLETINGKPENPDGFNYLHQILEEQNYRLTYWKTGTHEINYRRFFAIDSLVGLKMESQQVFDDSHRLLQSLIQQGIVSGVRIDHIDGLRDPAQYLQRLSNLAGRKDHPFYTLVEKILTEKEDLPIGWATHGTTGYDFIGSMINLLIASSSESAFTGIYSDFTGVAARPDEQAYRLKLYIMEELFPNAVDNFALELEAHVKSDRRWRDWTVSDLRPALARIIACLSVYRTYRVAGEDPTANDVQLVERAVTEALRLSHSADPLPYHFIQDLWTRRYPDEKAGPEMKVWADSWICRLQQYTGAIMAKSVEDTLFYRYVRLFAANEVGHHPAEFGRTVADFHEGNRKRLNEWPASMLASSTHDTKMSEDVRARLLALSANPDRWDTALHRWSKMNHPSKTEVNNLLAPDANEEYLLYQILLGAWPLDGNPDDAFLGRIKNYMRKALSESQAHTNWANPVEPWLKACERFIDTLLDRETSRAFWEDFGPFAENLARQGMKISLIQTALKLTLPGVPDFYQGTELWDFSLVDPDNRRPVNYGLRQELLQSLDQTSVLELRDSWKDGRIKMYLIRALLRYRREHPALFAEGAYNPLKITGLQAERFVAFARRHEDVQLLVVTLRNPGEETNPEFKDLCAGISLSFPEASGPWRNLLSGQKIIPEKEGLTLDALLDDLPFAILVSEG